MIAEAGKWAQRRGAAPAAAVLLTAAVLLLTAILLLTAADARAAQASGPEAWISPDGTLTADAIAITKNTGKGYTLYLPGNLDLAAMKIGLAEGVKLTVKNQEIGAGDSAEALMDQAAIRVNKKGGVLTILQGSKGLPAVYITTESGTLDRIEANKNNKEPGYLVFRGRENETQYDGPLSHLKTRGNSSMTFKKKNYQMKLETGASLMDMGKAKKWILTGNYRDKAFLRNQIMLDLADYIGLPYTPAHQAAELYINHEYRGLYLLSEKVEIEDDRVDIFDLEKATEAMNEHPLTEARLIGQRKATKGAYKAYQIENEPEDVTGGYLIEYESYPVRYGMEASAYTTLKGGVVIVKSPEYVSERQMEYISGLVQAFENAIMAKDGIDPGTGKHYTDIMDAESLALKYMIEEISENYDGNSSSQFFYKPADAVSEKLCAGPVWDYDSSFGAYAAQHNVKKVTNPKYLWIAGASKSAWYPALYQHQDFRRQVAALWQERVKAGVEILLGERASDTPRLRSIDEYAAEIADSVVLDRLRWPKKKNAGTVAQTGYTFEENITYLKDFLAKRRDFLEEEWAE